MMVNFNGKYTDYAKYYYNPYIDRWCVVGTTICTECVSEIEELFQDKTGLIEIDTPAYVTEEYEWSEW